MADLEGDNANIRQQHRDWQKERRDAGQDVNDWNAFREHLTGIGAPDPGEEEVEDFRMEESQMGSEAKTA